MNLEQDFTPSEQQFYEKHLLLEQVGELGQKKLKQAKVLVIGAGGLGCPILQYINAAGVGTIGIIDADVVSVSNLHRQILYGIDDVGKPKVNIAKQKLHAQNPHTIINTYQKFLTKENAISLFQEYDIIVEGSDNFATKYLANDAAVLTGKPLVFGSIYQFQGQVSVFNYQGGATYRCVFPEMPKPEDSPNCSDIGVIGILPGVIGSFQANEVLKLILGIGKPLSNQLLIWNALNNQQTLLSIKKNEAIQITELQEEQFNCQIMNTITIEEVNQNKEAYHILDVRTKVETLLKSIGGENIPLQEIPNRVDEIKDWEKPIVVHCAKGIRSAQAIEYLQQVYPEKEFYNLENW